MVRILGDGGKLLLKVFFRSFTKVTVYMNRSGNVCFGSVDGRGRN